MLRRVLPALFLLGALLVFAGAPLLWGEDPFIETASAGAGATGTATATVPPSATATGVATTTATLVATATATSGTLTPATASPTATGGTPVTLTATVTPTPGGTGSDLQLTVSANPNPVQSGQVFSFFIRVFNQGTAASPATHVRVTIPGGASTSLATGSGNCVLNPATGQYSIPGTGQNYSTYNQCINAFGAGSPNCLFNSATQQYYNAATGQVYSSYSQCISAAGTGTANCVLNLSTGQYFNAATGQTYNSYNDCINAAGVGFATCTLIPGTSQYYNSATGQIYSTQSECLNASGSGIANCVALPGTGQYYNPATGQVYSTYTECVSAGGSGSIIGSNCLPNTFQGYVDCPIPSLQPGASASISVPFFVTVVGGSLFGSFQVDPNNVVIETNEANNTTTLAVNVIPGLSGQFPFPPLFPDDPPPPPPAPEQPAPPVPSEPVPPVFVPAPPVTQPQPPAAAGARWLHVLAPTQAYSVTMDPLWMATPGEWYFVVMEEAGWALAVWEGDTSDWSVWIQIDGRVEIQISDRPIPQLPLWLIVLSPTPAYSVTMDPLWTASPGERYKVREQEDGWALAIWEFDSPDWQVWIQEDGRVQLTHM